VVEKKVSQSQNRNIDTSIHFIPVHKHAYFANALSVTNQVVQKMLTLPLHSNMKTEFVERVIEDVVSFF
jgi:dTDP-4-amino-4,6-dideoxygalactose transaminase